MTRLFALALSAAALAAAQGLDSLSGWQFYREISAGPNTGIAALTLEAEILANTTRSRSRPKALVSGGK